MVLFAHPRTHGRVSSSQSTRFLGEVCKHEIKLETFLRKWKMIVREAPEGHLSVPALPSGLARGQQNPLIQEWVKMGASTPSFPPPASGTDSLCPQLLSGEVWEGHARRVIRGPPPFP